MKDLRDIARFEHAFADPAATFIPKRFNEVIFSPLDDAGDLNHEMRPLLERQRRPFWKSLLRGPNRHGGFG